MVSLSLNIRIRPVLWSQRSLRYNWPASRQDFIDLHGFEDDELFRPKAALPKDKEGLNDNADKNAFDQFMARENKTQASQIRSSYQNHHRCDVRSHNVDSKRFQTPMQDPNCKLTLTNPAAMKFKLSLDCCSSQGIQCLTILTNF